VRTIRTRSHDTLTTSSARPTPNRPGNPNRLRRADGTGRWTGTVRVSDPVDLRNSLSLTIGKSAPTPVEVKIDGTV
jgi:hypothetical protein